MKRNKFIIILKPFMVMSVLLIAFLIIFTSIFSKGEAIKGADSFEIGNDSIKVSYVKGEGVTISGNNMVKMYNANTGKVEELQLEDYVKGVVSAEMPANFSEEAIKAQAIAARTYYFSKRISNCSQSKGGEICNTTHCQVYISKEEKMKQWGSQGEVYWSKVSKAVDDTAGKILVYNGKLVMYPQFFATSSGKTEDAKDVLSQNVPYLVSTESPGEESAPKYETKKTISLSNMANSIIDKYPNSGITTSNIQSKIQILSRTLGGAVKEIKLGESTISGVDFRRLLNLNSANFTLEFSASSITINCKGYGHGVGMSQWGANAMAKNGSDYEAVLKHYYTGVEIEKIKYEDN